MAPLRRPAAKPSIRKVQSQKVGRSRGRASATVASDAFQAGQLIFQEDPLVCAQVARKAEDFVEQQPLFCAQCGRPCGSLLMALGLANHTIHRAELLNVLRTTGQEGMQKWMEFATKRRDMPGTSQAPGLYVLDVPDTSPLAELCFCSLECRNDFPRCVEKVPLLMAANKLLAKLALLEGRMSSKEEFMSQLQPLLQCVRRRPKQSFSMSMLQACHGRLVGMLAERLPGTKAAARKAVKSLVDFEFYSHIVASLDLRSWALNGETMPSPLGQYCETSFNATATDLQREVTQVIGPVVEDLLQLQDELSESSAEEPELVVSLPQTDEAKKSSVVFWPKLLSDEEIDQILHFSSQMRGECPAQWSTCYLQSGNRHGSLQPILKKLKDLALHVDQQPDGWNRLPQNLHHKLRSRCVEHHSVTTGGALPDPTHFDGGSLFTIDVMLNRPGVDFQGGEFCTMESDDQLRAHSFGKGDALVFLSHKAHCVQPVTQGLRQTLVMELWEGEERCCNHRCHQRWGPCRDPALRSKTWSVERLRAEAPGLFAHTAFEGVAFFPKVGQILAQSRAEKKSAANVEVVFEESHPKASLRAIRRIRKGEILVLK